MGTGPTGGVIMETRPNPPVSKAMARAASVAVGMMPVFVDFTTNPHALRPPDYYLHVFSIVPRKFMIRRPPNFPLITFSPCPPGQPYVEVARVPNVVNEMWTDAYTGKAVMDAMRGERFATDLINPLNLGEDIWQDVDVSDPIAAAQNTDNLTYRGVFWTRNEVPTQEELAKCKARLEKHYRALLMEANDLASDPKTVKDIGREHHLAADYFKYRASWHIVAEAPAVCPNCGEAIKAGVAFHIGSVGMICVIDWKRTVAAGVKKRDEVPAEARWW